MKELLKTTASVLREHKMPTKALPQVLEASLQNKAKLNSIFGLTEETLYRASISMDRKEADIRKDYPMSYAVVGHILNEAKVAGADIDLSTISLVKNSVKVKNQEGKISKILSKYIKEHPEVLDSCMKELKISKYEQFLPKLGDIVKSGRKLWVSTNLLDILAASSNASFTSCHSMGGGYFNGNIAYAVDPITLVTFVTEEKCKHSEHKLHKLGRGWAFVLENTIVQAKSYGAYYGFEREVARGFMQEKLAAHLGFDLDKGFTIGSGKSIPKVEFESPKDVNKNSGQGALYFDNYDLVISYPKGQKSGASSIKFSAAMCLECGQTTDYSSKGTCAEHDGKVKETCAVCGERHLVSNLHHVSRQYYCSACYSKTFARCSECGTDHLKADLETIDGRLVCKKCKKENYTVCAVCGGFHNKSKLDELKGIGHVCYKCREQFLLCSICNEYHPKEQVIYHKYVGRVCNRCLPETAEICSVCGEYHPKTDLNSTKECPACVARKEGREIEIKIKPKYAGLPEGFDDFVEIVG